MTQPRRQARLWPFLALLLCGFGAPRVGDRLQLPDFEVQRAQLQGIRQSVMLPVTAKAVLLLDFASNRVLYDKAAHQLLPPASTTKIMTALLTLEMGGLDDQVTVSPLAASQEGTSMNLQAGERLTVRELLYGLLLPSGNDAAVALAERNAGTVGAFVERMNARAKALGLTELHFVNPHGLDDPQHLMSAYDVAELARYTLTSQPLFAQFVRTAHMVLPAEPGHPALDLTNLNQLLGSYPGADGVKTGTTPAAGQNLVGSATQDGHRLMAVIYNSQDRYADARKVLDTGFSSYAWFRTDQYFPFEPPVIVRNADEVLLPLWEESQIQAFIDADWSVAHFSLLGREIANGQVELKH